MIKNMIYEKYELVSNDNPHLYNPTTEYWSPSLEDLLAFTQEADMKELSSDDIKNHFLGCSIVGSRYQLPFANHHSVLSYAGITGSDDFQGKLCAIIGGVIVHPEARKIGLGSLTVNWLIQTASSNRLQDQLKYDGFIARCNKISIKLFAHLGFVAIQEEESKTTMFKSLVQ